ncbi:MAG TPA: cation-translocating P-type ATPase C-terminal domain-containing protein [Streptosporangiaceae bacterium]|nr:cation-translocating P-type ATPase C-terminal domain-containing protein [Streptosporangiaceae bacterium]
MLGSAVCRVGTQAPILTRGLIAWLAFVGLLMAIGTLSVITWADHAHGLAIARTMGMVTFELFNLFFSIESKDERDSAFSLSTFSDKTFLITTSVSLVLLVLSTVLGIFHTVMKTTRLDVRQWLICTAVALAIVAAAEIRKALRRRPPPPRPWRPRWPGTSMSMTPPRERTRSGPSTGTRARR